jgi:hypothetical protein
MASPFLAAMLIPDNSPGAALLLRRADGQFSFGRIDARVARAARAAAAHAALRALEREELELPAAQPLEIKLL